MTPEKQTKEPGSQKQKVMIVVVIGVVLFLAWQMKAMFGGDSAPPPPTIPAKPGAQQMTAKGPGGNPAPAPVPGATPTSMPPGGLGAVPGGGGPAAPSAESGIPKQSMLQANAELLRLQQETQKKYIAALNELEMLKLKIEIAKANESLTNTKLSTITTEKKMSDLLTVAPPPPPPAPLPTLPEGTFASNMASPVAAGQSIPGGSASAGGAAGALPSSLPPGVVPGGHTPPAESAPPAVAYIVLSVSYKDNKWNTVIGYQDKLYSVSVGDILPTDGSKVLSINKNGVVLGTKDGKKRTISMSQTI